MVDFVASRWGCEKMVLDSCDSVRCLKVCDSIGLLIWK